MFLGCKIHAKIIVAIFLRHGGVLKYHKDNVYNASHDRETKDAIKRVFYYMLFDE